MLVAIFTMNYSHFVKYHRFDKVVHLCIHESSIMMARGILRTQVSSMSKISEGNQSKCKNICIVTRIIINENGYGPY